MQRHLLLSLVLILSFALALERPTSAAETVSRAALTIPLDGVVLRASMTVQPMRSTTRWDPVHTIVGSAALGIGAIYGLRGLSRHRDCGTVNDLNRAANESLSRSPFATRLPMLSCGKYMTEAMIGFAAAGFGSYWVLKRARVRVSPSLTNGGMRLSTHLTW